jgi:hypothetical protein
VSQTAVAVIEAVTVKEGATNGKAWKKFSVKTEDGTYYSTFDSEIATQAKAFIGQRADIFWKPSGNENQFRDILGAKAAEGFDSGALPSAQKENGAADWDLIGLRKTRCLLWAKYLSSPLAVEAAKSTAGEKPTAHRVYDFGVAVIELAERDIYWREPAASDTDIPFG